MVSKTMNRVQEHLEKALKLLTPISNMAERLERIEAKLDQLLEAQEPVRAQTAKAGPEAGTKPADKK